MPFKYTKTTPANLPWGKSVQFNGTNQYLSVGAASNWTFLHNGSSWTAECWFNVPSASLSNQYTLISTDAETANIGTTLTLNNTTAGDVRVVVYKGVSGQTAMNVTANSSSFTPNTWNHAAAVYNSSTSVGTVYINGVAIASASGSGFSTNAPTYTLAIGRYQAATPSGYLNGYISNLRIANSVLYTASFTPPTSPLNVVANTSLLACHDTSIKDGSVNNFTITTSGTPSISTATPFVVSAKSVLFNGTNQYLSVGSVANWAFLNNGLTPFTIEAWVNPTSVATAVQPNIVATTGYQAQIGFYFVIGNYNNGDLTFAICDGRSKINQWATSNNFLTANTWTHVAVSFTPNGTNVPSATVKFFVNGVLATSSNVLTNTTTYSTSNPTNTLLVGAYQTPFDGYFPGYISNLRIVNGTALYTASFTALAEPLTSVASCSLLTCNSPTIIDSSTNNFTITNNGSATVSSVVPFNAVGYGYKFNNRNNVASVLAGTQKAIFGYGTTGTVTAVTNLVSNTGVVATDTAGVGTARSDLAAAGYGIDKAIFGYGNNGITYVSITNLVSNTGVVASDTTGVGTARYMLAAAGYGTDKSIFGYGYTSTGVNVSITNKVSNTGVVAMDTTGVGTARYSLAAAGYGSDKAIFG